MEHTRKDFIAIIVGLSIAGVLAFVVVTHSGRDHQDVVVPNSGQAVDTSSTSTYLVATTPTVVTRPSSTHRDYSGVSRHISEAATTTTSEVPAPLTPEQEAKIPGPETDANPDADEHMSSGTDYDLPYASVDMPEPQS
jgi:hypothetical protein